MPDLAGKKTVYYGFTGLIEPASATRLATAFNRAVNNGCDQIYLCLSSTGGYVADGVFLYNHIMSLPTEIIIHNTGTVMSIAAAFYIGAPLRIRDLTEDDWLNGLWPSAAMLAPGFPGVFRAPIELFPLQDRAQAISYPEYCHTAAARRFSWSRRRML